MHNKFQVISQGEYDDFSRICQSNGFDFNEFNLNEHDISSSKPDIVGPIYGKLTISRNGTSQTYNIGYGSRWLLQFEIDLISSYF